MRSRVVLGIVTAWVLGWASTAAAEAKRVGVPRFDGPQEGVVRKAVMQVLKGEGYQVVGARELDAAAKGAGAQLDSNDGFKAVAKELSISSFVTGEVAKKKAKLTVRNGYDGSVSGEGSFAGANPKKVGAEVRGGFSRRLGSAVARGRAPAGAKAPTAAPVAEAEPPDEKDDQGDKDDNAGDDEAKAAAEKPAATTSRKTTSSDETPPPDKTEGSNPEGVVATKPPEEASGEGPAPRALDLAVGFRGFTRSLTYNDDVLRALRNYKLNIGPALTADVVVYPVGFFSSGIGSYIGGEGHIEQAFGISSNVPPTTTLPNGTTLQTIIHDYWGGLRFRLPFGPHEASLGVGAGEQAFKFSGAGRDMLGDTPDTIYRYYRIGADARFVLPGGVVLGLGGAYRGVYNRAGEIHEASFFPYLTVYGVDFNAKLGYLITPSLEVRLGLDLRRYAFNMHSQPSDLMGTMPAQVAGGAVDQYLSGTIGVAYVFGGVAPGASPPDDEAPAPEKKHGKKKKKKAADEDEGGGGNAGGGDSDE